MKKNEVPMEYRPISRRPNGAETGSLEMWVEMMDSRNAGKVPRFNLQKPSSTDIEIRWEIPPFFSLKSLAVDGVYWGI